MPVKTSRQRVFRNVFIVWMVSHLTFSIKRVAPRQLYVYCIVYSLFLIAMGCRRIAHLRGPDQSVGTKLLQGYDKALAKAGIAFDPKWITPVSTGNIDSKVQAAEYTQ